VGIPEQIKKIEDDLHRTQVNKKTEHHIGLLKAKLAKLRLELEERQSRHVGSAIGFDIKRAGDATVVLMGFPSVGKSTILNRLTNARSKVGAYQFTTLNVVPGILNYNGARIQILDIPGIIDGASSGRGLGKRVLSIARHADLILFVVDVFQPDAREILRNELYAIGIRVDEKPPNVLVEETGSGGIQVSTPIKLTNINEQIVKDILRIYEMNNARVIIREDITDEQFVDAIQRNRVYVRSLTIMNKIDLVNTGFINEISRKLNYNFIPVSAESGINLTVLKEEIYKRLDFIRIYMRKRNGETDLEEPLIVKNGSTVLDICNMLHRKMRDEFRYAQVWGRSVKFEGQRVGISHRLMDKDIITLITR
jgi:ribosome-interacting GTPase 1